MISHAEYILFLATNPTLTSAGFRDIDQPDYEAARHWLIESYPMFCEAVAWIESHRRLDCLTSYGLKHLIERGTSLGYCHEGAAIAAAIMLGKKHRRSRTGICFGK